MAAVKDDAVHVIGQQRQFALQFFDKFRQELFMHPSGESIET